MESSDAERTAGVSLCSILIRVDQRQDSSARVGLVVGLDHVQVASPPGSEADARHFYGSLLGLREVEKPAALRSRGGVWFACGEQELHVGVSSAFVPAEKAHPAFLVTSAGIDELAARLTAAGVKVDWDGAIPGRRRFYAADPWGNRVEFTTT